MAKWGYDIAEKDADTRRALLNFAGTAKNKYDFEAEQDLIKGQLGKDLADIAANTIQTYSANKQKLGAEKKAEALQDAQLRAAEIEKLTASESMGSQSPIVQQKIAEYQKLYEAPADPKEKPGFLKRMFVNPTKEDYREDAGREFSRLTSMNIDSQAQRNNQQTVSSLMPRINARVGVGDDFVGPLPPEPTPLERAEFQKAQTGRVDLETLDAVKKFEAEELHSQQKEWAKLDLEEKRAAAGMNFDKTFTPEMFINQDAYHLASVVYEQSGGDTASIRPYMNVPLTKQQEEEQTLRLQQLRQSVQLQGLQIKDYSARAEGAGDKELKGILSEIDKDIADTQKRLELDPENISEEGATNRIRRLTREKAKIQGQAGLNSDGIPGIAIGMKPDENGKLKDIVYSAGGQTFVYDPATKKSREFSTTPWRGQQPGAMTGEGIGGPAPGTMGYEKETLLGTGIGSLKDIAYGGGAVGDLVKGTVFADSFNGAPHGGPIQPPGSARGDMGAVPFPKTEGLSMPDFSVFNPTPTQSRPVPPIIAAIISSSASPREALSQAYKNGDITERDFQLGVEALRGR